MVMRYDREGHIASRAPTSRVRGRMFAVARVAVARPIAGDVACPARSRSTVAAPRVVASAARELSCAARLGGEVRRGVLLSRGRTRRATRVPASRRGAAFALFGPPPDPDALLAEGKALYASGERMQGYKTFEKALRVDDIRLETRQELLYCCMCCNAAFGDVETAKQYLRDMNLAGLSFDVAMVRAPTAIAPGSAPTPRRPITPSLSATTRIFR